MFIAEKTKPGIMCLLLCNQTNNKNQIWANLNKAERKDDMMSFQLMNLAGFNQAANIAIW